METSACPPSKFRAPTGECNNINHRHWGSRGDVFLRIGDPQYSDAISQPRLSVGSHSLPTGDEVVHALQRITNAKLSHPHITAMLPAWGQLLAYDLIQVTTPKTNIKCCDDETVTTSEDLVQCYVKLGDKCKEYKRSVPSQDLDSCEFKQREQMNSASGFIDGSGLYGATESEFTTLRSYINGKVVLKACARCHEPGAVGALHTLLIKEHNRVADVLFKLNPSWTDTTLFLEARRAVTAQIQHITYNEFLPVILGQPIVNKDELRLVSGKHYNGYSSTHRAGIFNEAAVGAFPAFLSMLPAEMVN